MLLTCKKRMVACVCPLWLHGQRLQPLQFCQRASLKTNAKLELDAATWDQSGGMAGDSHQR